MPIYFLEKKIKKNDEIILKYSITWNYFFLCIDSKSMAMQKFITLSVISI